MSDLAQRSVSAVRWRTVSSLAVVCILLVRSVCLARLLPVDAFGVYALASSVVGLSIVFADFGMQGAFLHRAPETQDEDRAAAVQFTMQGLFIVTWMALLVPITLLLTEDELRTATLVLTGTIGMQHVAQTPQIILIRRVVHRRLALIQLLTAVATTVVALTLASRGVTLWALLATDIVTLVVMVWGLYLWRPVWHPRVALFPDVVRYYVRFGLRTLIGELLLRAQDQLDDLWTGAYLGQAALGFYSRAYTFATYPRRVIAVPVNIVVGGTYAELKENRRLLSQSFFRTNAYLVRVGFLVAGLLALLAPGLVRVVLGEKWLPMVDAFRLMLVFTLLDPIRTTVADLFVAVGRPEIVIRARLLQVLVLLAGLLLLGTRLGIAGVALSVNAMLVTGLSLLLRQARAYVDFSVRRLFLVPTLALIAGLFVAQLGPELLAFPDTSWQAGLVKMAVYASLFTSIELALEREQVLFLVRRALGGLRR